MSYWLFGLVCAIPALGVLAALVTNWGLLLNGIVHRAQPKASSLPAIGSIAGILFVQASAAWHRRASGPDLVGDRPWLAALGIAVACELPWVLGLLLPAGKERRDPPR